MLPPRVVRSPKSVGLAENREAEGFQQFQKASCSPSQVEEMPRRLDTPLWPLLRAMVALPIWPRKIQEDSTYETALGASKAQPERTTGERGVW